MQNSPIWDLHELRLSAACILVADSLLKVLKQDTSEELSVERIIVVTGKGLRSDGEGPILRSGVPDFLRKTFGPEIALDERNAGRFHLTRKALRNWVDSGNADKFRSQFTGATGHSD